jgi:hypothetical protein
MSFAHALRTFAAAALFAGFGCTPMSDQEKAYLEQVAREREEREEFSSALGTRDEMAEAIKKVKEASHPESESMLTWVAVEENERAKGGSVIYRQWSAALKSHNLYEVKYLFTVLKRSDYEAVKHGFSWTYHDVMEQVEGPREMERDELEPRTRRKVAVVAEEESPRDDPWSLE